MIHIAQKIIGVTLFSDCFTNIFTALYRNRPFGDVHEMALFRVKFRKMIPKNVRPQLVPLHTILFLISQSKCAKTGTSLFACPICMSEYTAYASPFVLVSSCL